MSWNLFSFSLSDVKLLQKSKMSLNLKNMWDCVHSFGSSTKIVNHSSENFEAVGMSHINENLNSSETLLFSIYNYYHSLLFNAYLLKIYQILNQNFVCVNSRIEFFF